MGKAIGESFFFLKKTMEKVPNWERSFVNREKGLFLSVYVDGAKLTGKKQYIEPMWKVLMNDVDKKTDDLKARQCMVRYVETCV